MKTKVVHSQSKDAWNIIGIEYGKKYKIARFPYCVVKDEVILTHRNMKEAFNHAEFASKCFNENYREE